VKVAGKSIPTPDRDGSGSVAAGYVSPLVLRSFIERPGANIPWIEKVSGTLLMADISGFTAMSEKLAESGREGAEMLTDIINRYFTAMLDAARKNGGHNLKFGGDALLLFFDGEDHASRAARTALDMQRENKRQPPLRIGGERHKPSVSIGLHSGEFWSAAVGEPRTRLQHVIFGEDVNRVVAAEGEANAGQVVATRSTVEDAWATDAPGEFAVITRVPAGRAQPGADMAARDDEDLDAYLPPPVLWALRGQTALGAGEHRGVVVMFIHATGFEGVAEARTPDEALSQLQAYTSELVRLTEQYGGFVVSNDIYFEGVKFIVVFGAPIAREEDTANAFRLGLALSSWLENSGLDVRHRIGINGGNAFAGDIGASYRREYTVMGDCVNLAARLMSAAEPGQVLVSRETATRGGPGFVFADLPPIRVKGKSAEITIASLDGLDATSAASAVDQRTPFVGRTRELDQLREACLRTEGGAGQALVMRGEAGAGKSRLLLEMLQYVRARGWEVHQARCFAHTSGSPFAPWTTVLQSIMGIDSDGTQGDRDEAALAAIKELCPEHEAAGSLLNPILGLNLAPSDVVESMDESTRGRRLMDLLSALIAGAASRAPTAVVLDDVQHADDGSIDLLRRVQSDARSSRLMLAVAEREHGRKVVTARSGAITMDVLPLGSEDSERMVVLALGPGARGVDIAGLLRKAQGNPLFIEEVARAARDAAGSGGEVPDRLQNLMMARIDRLDPGLRDVVRVAAVAGNDIDSAQVAAGLREIGLRPNAAVGLSRLAREGILEAARDEGGYNFSHSVLQEVAYGNLSYSLRRRIHGGVARDIESSRADLSPVLELLAHHFDRSGDRPKTFEYAVKSGEKARLVFANDDAIRHYRRASAVVGEAGVGQSEVADVAASLGDVLELTGRHAAAKEAYIRALEAYLGQRLHRAADPHLLRFGEITPGLDPALRSRAADVCRKLGYVGERQSDYGPALAWFEGSLAALPRGDAVGRGSSLMGIAGVHYRAGRFDEAEAWALKGLRTLRATGVSGQLARAHNVIGLIHRDEGRVRSAIKHRLQALAMFQSLGDVMGQADMLNNLGLDYFSGGAWPDAIQRFRECLQIAERIGDTELVAIVRNNLGEIYLAQGGIEEAKREFREAAAMADQIGNGALTGLADANLGEALTMEGQHPEARTALRKSLRTLKKVGAQSLVMEAEVRLAELHFATRDYYAAETLANKLLDASRKAEARPIEGRALRLLGVLAARRKRPDEAEALLRESIAAFAAADSAHGEAKSRLALAQAVDDRAEARKALRMFELLGAARDVEEAEDLLAA